MVVNKDSNLWNKIKSAYKNSNKNSIDSGWILIELFYDDFKYSLNKRKKFTKNNKKDYKKFSKWFHKKLGADYAYAIDSVVHEKWVTPYFLYGLLRQLQYMHKQNLTFRDDMLYEQNELKIYPINKHFISKVINETTKDVLSHHLLEMICCEELNFDITKLDSDILNYIFKEWVDKLNGWDYKNIIDKYFVKNYNLEKLMKNIKLAQQKHSKFKTLTKKHK